MQNAYKPKQLRLKEMPLDIYQILLRRQAEIKGSCHCQYSLEQTIYRLIRDADKQPDLLPPKNS